MGSSGEAVQEQAPAPGGGVLLARWTTLRIPPGGIVLRTTDDGSPAMGPVKVELSLAMWPHWLDMTVRHATTASKARKRVLASHAANDSSSLHDALTEEFQAGVQSISASAFALDGLYAELDEVAVIPQTTKDLWTKNRTSRAKRLAEVLRLTSVIPNHRFTKLRTGIVTVFRFRDEAVHPVARFAEPLLARPRSPRRRQPSLSGLQRGERPQRPELCHRGAPIRFRASAPAGHRRPARLGRASQDCAPDPR